MRHLSLDYQRTAHPAARIGVALLVAGMAALLPAAAYYRGVAQDIARWEARIARVEHQSRRAAGVDRRTQGQQLAVEMKQANEVLLQLALPWNDLFQAVENASSDEIALLSIEPDAQKQLVKISGEARNLDAMLDYVRLLQESGSLVNVNLENHQIHQQDPDKPIRFALVASWVAGHD